VRPVFLLKRNENSSRRLHAFSFPKNWTYTLPIDTSIVAITSTQLSLVDALYDDANSANVREIASIFSVPEGVLSAITLTLSRA
jgi:hypothetical protein